MRVSMYPSGDPPYEPIKARVTAAKGAHRLGQVLDPFEPFSVLPYRCVTVKVTAYSCDTISEPVFFAGVTPAIDTKNESN